MRLSPVQTQISIAHLGRLNGVVLLIDTDTKIVIENSKAKIETSENPGKIIRIDRIMARNSKWRGFVSSIRSTISGLRFD